jgi:hypothetical protein
MQNLAGQPPLGNHPALCHQSSPTAGDAACEKNCVVYPPSGEPFTLPASECTVGGDEPTTTLTFINPGTNLPTHTATDTDTDTAEPTTTITFINPGTNLPTHTATDSDTAEPTTTITYIHSVHPSGTQSGAPTFTTAMVNPGHGGNGTGPGTGTGGPKPPISTAGAVANQVAGTLAVLGGLAAMLL